jgi:hypothetical protein
VRPGISEWENCSIADDFLAEMWHVVIVMQEYFITMAVMFVVYCFMRPAFTLPPAPKRSLPMTGHGIDVKNVSDRVAHLREELKLNKISGTKSDFKRALRVENRREEISRLSFFQTPRPQPPEESDHDHRLDLILI